jgi:hypothetical protein
VGHGIPIEVWASRFATALCAAQPSVGRSLALELATAIHPTISVLRPEDAAQTFLQVQLQSYEAAGEAAGAVLRALREGKGSN